MNRKYILLITRNSLQWGFLTFTASFFIFNISDIFNQNKIMEPISLSIAALLIAFSINYFKLRANLKNKLQKGKMGSSNENQYLILFLTLFSFLVIWYIFVGKSWETEKLEKIVSIIFTWPSVALIALSLFYPIIKSNLLNFLSNFANGQFNLRFGDLELSPRQLDAAIEEAAENVRKEASGSVDSFPSESSRDLSQYPEMMKPIADRAKRKEVLNMLPEAFFIFLFGQAEKVLRILFYANVSFLPAHRVNKGYSIRYVTQILFDEGLIDKKFFEIFINLIGVRNSISHGAQSHRLNQDELKQICDYLSEYITKEYSEQKELFDKYWDLDLY